jgi:hypothetical protein
MSEISILVDEDFEQIISNESKGVQAIAQWLFYRNDAYPEPKLELGSDESIRASQIIRYFNATILIRRDEKNGVVTLFDLAKGDFPISQSFRTVQVFECGICGSLSNRAFWANCFMGGARNFCPNNEEKWHYRLQAKRELLMKPHPESYKRELRQEIEQLLQCADVRNDLVGKPDVNRKARAVLQAGFIADGYRISPHEIHRLDQLDRLSRMAAGIYD